MCPSKVSIDRRNITVIKDGEPTEESVAEGSLAGGGTLYDKISDKRSIKSLAASRSRKVSPKERKTPKPINIEDSQMNIIGDQKSKDDNLKKTDSLNDLIES